jgi:hypothetical protein
VIDLASEDYEVRSSVVSKLETFARSLTADVQRQLQSVRDMRAEREAIEAAKRFADEREREEALARKAEVSLPKIEHDTKEQLKMAVDEDSDLEDFIESDPWATAKKQAPKTDTDPVVSLEPGKNLEAESPKTDESPEQPSQKLKIQQKKLKPKGK